MSANLIDPFPHASVVTPSDSATLPVKANALLLCGIAATTATIKITTVGGETLTITLSQTSLPAVAAFFLPIQVQQVWSTGTTGIATIVALNH